MYRAKDLKLGRDVAIKVLPGELASDHERLGRFEQEARAASALNHPNIITIHEIGRHESIPYIVMELVDGRTLREVLADGPLTIERLFHFAGQIAKGMAAAHSAGIVHRDLKPENLMVTRDGDIKILDFGLAKLLRESSELASSMPTFVKHETREGLVVGTVQYMSPEQAGGRPIDYRSDQFSYGSILYQMATGRLPFRRDSIAQTMTAIIEDEPEPVVVLNPKLPAHLSVIIMRCLAKDPQERYDSSRDLAKEVKLESGEHDRSVRASGTFDVRTSRRRFVALGAGVLFVVLALVVGLSSRGPRDTPAGEAAARQMIVVLPFENLGPPEDEYFADGMTDEITSRLGTVDGIGVISRKSALRYAGTDKGTQEIGEELGVDFILGGSIRWAARADGASRVRITPELIRVDDDSQLWSASYERVIEDIFEVQSDIAGQVIERLGVTLGDGARAPLTARQTENTEAYTLYLKGRHFWNKRTKADMETGLSYFQQAVELDPGYALAHVGIADAWIFRGWYSILAPKETFPKAKHAALQALEFDDTFAEPHTSLAHIYFEFDHDWEAAEKEYTRAIELNPKHATAHHWYSRYLSGMGRHEESLRHAETARELDPLSLIINTWVGMCHYLARRYDVAITEYQKALELGPNFTAGHWHAGWAFEQTGRYEEAIAHAQRAVERSGGSPTYMASLGHAYAIAGKLTEAREILEQLEEASRTSHVSAYHVAVIHGALGEIDEGFGWLDLALEEQSPWIGFMRVDPRLDPFRSDARFDALLQQAHLDV